MRRGHPSRELAYTPITSLTTADRRAAQCDLLDGYRKSLLAAGGPDLGRDELWDRYRQAALYAYVTPLITAGMGGMQNEGIAMEGLQRGVEVLEDLETVALLKKSLRLRGELGSVRTAQNFVRRERERTIAQPQ